ncbi:MAG: DUF1926 domain-containing protein [Treponema sp.]|jgi:hypothetical protein|nr:DUF1926 domain-containing protein [Treponema sp.]
MNDTISFILGAHHHLPYGAGDDEFERAYNARLKPFISTLYKYPKIQAVLHYSGVLLHWIEKAHPEFFMLIDDLVSRKQVELLGGGFYEPMMPLLPLPDKIGQIELLTTYLRKQFGKRPQGCRLPALAWEQHMVGPLSTCGMGYTFLDEAQFKLAGLSGEAIAPCISEDQGKLITIFPIASRIHVEFAQKRASMVMEDLVTNNPTQGERIICVFPEELFAENGPSQAPEVTFHQFFEDLSRFESRVEFTSPGRFFKNLKGLQKVYFPSSMAEGALATDAFGSPSSLPQRFLISFPEANGIYAKMMFTHVLINQLRGDKSRKRIAREELWKAQGYDSFCPAVHGGIYRSSIRKAAYKALLGAEKITREKGDFIPSLMNFDFDLDGDGEYLFQGEDINCYIKLEGASVFELDYLPKTWNYLDTFSQCGELNPISGDGGTRRSAFADYLVPSELTFQEALKSRLTGHLVAGHPGVRFCGNERFELVALDREHGKVHFRLPAKPGGGYGAIEVDKTYHLKHDTLSLHYSLTNQGKDRKRCTFIPSIDLSFPGTEEAILRIFKLHTEVTNGTNEAVALEATSLQNLMGIKLQDIKNEVIIYLMLDQPYTDQRFDAWIIPIQTPCPIAGGVIDMYQSTCIMPRIPLSLGPGEHFETGFTLRICH